MNLQRISEFAENQEGKAFLLVKQPRRASRLHSEVFA
jgi:Holliday junction resolvase